MSKGKQSLSDLFTTMQAKLKQNEKLAKELFFMVTEERTTQASIKKIATQEVLLQLILMCIDLTKTSRGSVNQIKSKIEAKSAKAKAQAKLHPWLDKNISKYKGNLENCAYEALHKFPDLGRSYSWIRKEITSYLKLKKQKQ